MRRPSRASWAFLPAAAAALAFAPLVPAPLYGDDRVFIDGAYILRLPWREFARLTFSRHYLPSTNEGTYQPLATLLHFFIVGHAFWYRLASLALHALTAGCVLALARRIGLSARAALAAALLFAVFPTHTETLSQACYQGHVLAAGFSLAAVLCWAAALDTGGPAALAGAFGCFALALLSKETGLLAAPLCALYSLLLARGRRPDLQRRAALAAALLGSVYLLWRWRLLASPGLGEPVPTPPAAAFGWYAAHLAWPLPLCRERVPPSWPWAAGAAGYLAALWAARRRPRALFGLLLAGVAIAPGVEVARHYKDSLVADRFLYLPAAGLSLALADALAETRWRGALAALVLVWAGASAARSDQYRDPGALYAQTTRCAPEHPKAWGVLAGWSLAHGRLSDAREQASKAVALAPLYPGAWGVLADAEAGLGDHSAAAEAVRRRDAAYEALAAPPPAPR